MPTERRSSDDGTGDTQHRNFAATVGYYTLGDARLTPATAPDVPDTTCWSAASTATSRWFCVLVRGRYVAEIWEKTQQEAFDIARTQHRELEGARRVSSRLLPSRADTSRTNRPTNRSPSVNMPVRPARARFALLGCVRASECQMTGVAQALLQPHVVRRGLSAPLKFRDCAPLCLRHAALQRCTDSRMYGHRR